MKKYIASLFTLACFATLPALGQKEKIQADRPGITLAPEITGKGILQAEIGFQRKQEQKGSNSYDHPEADIRYGLSDRFELRAEFIAESKRDLTTNDTRYGLKPVEVGFKAKLIEDNGAIPAITFFTHVGIPGLASRDHKAKHASPEIKLLFKNALTDNLDLDYNFGPEWDGEDVMPQWFYSVGPDLQVGEKVEVFMELFGRMQKMAPPEHNVDCGFGFYPGNNVKLDIFGGIGLSKAAPDYFVSVGVSFRLKP